MIDLDLAPEPGWLPIPAIPPGRPDPCRRCQKLRRKIHYSRDTGLRYRFISALCPECWAAAPKEPTQ